MKIKINTGKHQCWSILLIKLQAYNFIQKQPTGSSSVKKVFWGVLTWKFEVLWTFSSEIKRSTIESEATLTNIVTLLKTCLFFSDIEVFWILIGRTISKHSFETSFSETFTWYFPDILRFPFMVFLCFMGKWWRSYISLANWQIAIYINLVNRDVLLNNWIS